jgi:hypothetical protein
MVIDDLKYLFIDFTLSDENPKHFYDLTMYFFKLSYCFPKVYYIIAIKQDFGNKNFVFCVIGNDIRFGDLFQISYFMTRM